MRITVASMPLSRKGPLDSVLLVMSEGAEKGFPILRQTYIILKTGQLLFSFGFPVEKKNPPKKKNVVEVLATSGCRFSSSAVSVSPLWCLTRSGLRGKPSTGSVDAKPKKDDVRFKGNWDLEVTY